MARGECGTAGELQVRAARTVQLKFGCCPAERDVEGRSSQIPVVKTGPLYKARAAWGRQSKEPVGALCHGNRAIATFRLCRYAAWWWTRSKYLFKTGKSVPPISMDRLRRTQVVIHMLIPDCDIEPSRRSSCTVSSSQLMPSTDSADALPIYCCRSFRQSQTSHPPIPCARTLRQLCAGSSKLTQLDMLSGTVSKAFGRD